MAGSILKGNLVKTYTALSVEFTTKKPFCEQVTADNKEDALYLIALRRDAIIIAINEGSFMKDDIRLEDTFMVYSGTLLSEEPSPVLLSKMEGALKQSGFKILEDGDYYWIDANEDACDGSFSRYNDVLIDCIRKNNLIPFSASVDTMSRTLTL